MRLRRPAAAFTQGGIYTMIRLSEETARRGIAGNGIDPGRRTAAANYERSKPA